MSFKKPKKHFVLTMWISSYRFHAKERIEKRTDFRWLWMAQLYAFSINTCPQFGFGGWLIASVFTEE